MTKPSALIMSNGKSNINPQKMRTKLNMRSIFRCMMEDGYYPTFEKTHILFSIDGNTAVVEYEEGVISIRIFYSIQEDIYDYFLEVSNITMAETFIVKPVILDDRKNIMFSFEMICGTIREFRKYFPLGIERLTETIQMHKNEMKRFMLTKKMSPATISAAEDTFITSSKGMKPLS